MIEHFDGKICFVALCDYVIKGHMTLWEVICAKITVQNCAKRDAYKSLGSEDLTFLFSYSTSGDFIIKGTCRLEIGSLST